jgi:uncharacterized protein YgiM (DUF1202 family)
MLAVNDSNPFFLHGPAQGNGPDRTLAKGDEVQVLRKEFGYSFVQLSDGQKGYVANDDLVVAPPESKPDHPKGEHSSPELNFESTPSLTPGFRY